MYGIVTLTHNTDLYNQMDAIKRELYAGLPHFFVYNEPADRVKNETDVIFRSSGIHPSGVPMMFEKFIYCLRNYTSTTRWLSCRYVIRSNSSTFLNLPVLIEYLNRLTPRHCYAGSITFDTFISGACIIFSWDAIEALLSHCWRFDIHDTDDVVISRVMNYAKIPMTDIPMKFLVDNVIPGDNEIIEMLERYPLIRVRNNADRERIDLAIWNSLYSAFRKMHGCKEWT
jgi:hypothetical protein